MRENKDYQLKVRLTQAEKNALQKYAGEHNLTISEVVRQALYRIVGGK